MFPKLSDFCPNYCNGSRKGVGDYLLAVCNYTGLSLEIVSYGFRTRTSVQSFEEQMKKEARLLDGE